MSITHGWTTAEPDDPAFDVSADELNDHTVDDGSFAAAKLAASATDKVFGRSTAGAGNGEEITFTAAARALADDADAAAMRATLGITLPRVLSVFGVVAPSATTGTWTPTVDAASSLGGYSISTGTVDDAITWPFTSDAGTYTLTLQHSKGASRGIYTVKIDGSSVGTIDGYNAGNTNNINNLTSIAITAGVHTIQFVMATKNGSASDYYGIINGWSLTRTGA